MSERDQSLQSAMDHAQCINSIVEHCDKCLCRICVLYIAIGYGKTCRCNQYVYIPMYNLQKNPLKPMRKRRRTVSKRKVY